MGDQSVKAQNKMKSEVRSWETTAFKESVVNGNVYTVHPFKNKYY